MKKTIKVILIFLCTFTDFRTSSDYMFISLYMVVKSVTKGMSVDSIRVTDTIATISGADYETLIRFFIYSANYMIKITHLKTSIQFRSRFFPKRSSEFKRSFTFMQRINPLKKFSSKREE